MAISAFRNAIVSVALMLPLVSLAAAGPRQDKKAAHLLGSNPVSGLQLYRSYCAVCHGNDLKGDGPISPDCKNPPPDLTTLAQRHEGKFPDAYVEDVIRNGVKKPAQGKTEMPTWGPIFASIPGTDPELVSIRIVNLTNYIKSMHANWISRVSFCKCWTRRTIAPPPSMA